AFASQYQLTRHDLQQLLRNDETAPSPQRATARGRTEEVGRQQSACLAAAGRQTASAAVVALLPRCAWSVDPRRCLAFRGHVEQSRATQDLDRLLAVLHARVLVPELLLRGFAVVVIEVAGVRHFD